MRRSYISTCTPAVLILVSVLLAGCATSAPTPAPSPSADASGGVTQALYRQLERWGGTRYRLGGMGRRGMDCSGLTYVVYRDVFDTRLPRTTEGQGEVGRSVRRDDLAPGDLVFFKTGRVQKHVGIYVEDGMFLHASRSDGVRMSSLSSGYWKSRYWKARRM